MLTLLCHFPFQFQIKVKKQIYCSSTSTQSVSQGSSGAKFVRAEIKDRDVKGLKEENKASQMRWL